MTTKQERKMLNNMNTAAQKTKLGDRIPVVVTKTLASGDITAGTGVGTAEIDTGIDVGAICSVTCIAANGTLREVTVAGLKSGSDTILEVTATSMAATDVLTVAVI